MPKQIEHIEPRFENDTTISFQHEVRFGQGDYSLLIRTHPGNIEYTELVLLEDGETEEPLICFPNRDIDTVIHALQMFRGNLKL